MAASSPAEPLVAPRRRRANWGWRSAGLFFLFPGAVVLLKPGIPLACRLLAAVACAAGLSVVVTWHWPWWIRRYELLMPLAGAANLIALNLLSGGRAFEVWEIVLWYAAGIMWIGLTQSTRSFWLAPLLVAAFLATSEAPWGSATIFAGSLTIAVMTTIAHLVSLDSERGRRAYARVRRGVRNMTAVARTGKISARACPWEIHRTTAATALELGFSGAGVAHTLVSRDAWEWRSWSGECLPRTLRADLREQLFEVAARDRSDRVSKDGHVLLLLSLFRSGDDSYVLVAHSPDAVEDDQLQALELLAAQTSRGLEIIQMAFYDELTQLPNRALFQDRLAEHLSRVQRDPEYSFALLYLDVDRLKALNDFHGHALGDLFLVELAARLRRSLRGLDYIHRERATPSRLGGDEFAVLLPGLANLQDATSVAKRLHALLSEPLVVDGREIVSPPSIGVVLSHARYGDPSEMMRDADTAMYRAKRNDQLRWAVFDSVMRVSVDRSLELERGLTQALGNEEIRLQYQPIVIAESGHPVGFEALMRWNHPGVGAIPPAEFIPLAEATGRIGELSLWAFQQAISELTAWSRSWPKARPLCVAVNLSRKQIGDPELLSLLRDLLRTPSLAPEQLIVEITESLALQDLGETRDFLKQLRALGLRLALDDFGTGYSSLSCLHELPVQIVKLDREFVVAAQKEERALRAVYGVVKMAHAMGLKVVAEGVEEPAQRDLMSGLHCDLVQGYLISPPMEAEVVSDWLRGQLPSAGKPATTRKTG